MNSKRKSIIQSLREMRKIAVPQANIYKITFLQKANMPGILTNILRVFEPINIGKGRKPNKEYEQSLNKYNDVLSDSPITIAAKLNTRWEHYNSHIIVQSSLCNFRCQYCYLDYRLLGKEVIEVSAEEILEQFFEQRKIAKTKGFSYNVLRISGGEPMLIPDLTLTCLRKIKQLGLEKEICVKTETNLSPLVKVDGEPIAAKWANFEELAQYSNFIIHPTVHGTSGQNIQENCQVSPEMFEIVCEGLQSLIEYKLDFYPSFGANTVPLKDVESFFEKTKNIHRNLPLRFAVRPFKFHYNAVTKRLSKGKINQILKQEDIINKWDTLLQSEYGVRYAEIPRHQISLK